ncbi:hypothetical protein FRC11_005763, partial [Ceratobasidium sp. 423]
MAWVLGWEDHSKKDEKPPASPPGPRGEIQPQGIHLHPGGNAKAGLPTPDLPAFPDLGRFFLGWLNRSRVEVAPDDGDTLKPDLRKLSGAAWIEAHDSNPGVGAYTKESGGKVYESLEEEIESSVSGVAVPSRDECVTVFENILKQTWQKCWERAWEKVMNNTLKELNTWTSNVKSTSLASNIRNSKLNGYSDLCHYMKSGDSEEENHWTIRSAFKASNLLYRVLEHSIPRCYEGAMTILYFPDRPALYDIASLTPTSKLKGITKAIHQDREQLLTHIELQERIRYLASTNRNRILGFPDTRVPKFPDNRTAIENIEAIWKMANSVDAKLEFMGSKDTIQPWLRQKEQTKKRQGDKNVITFARVRAQHVWQKTLRDVRVHTRKIVGSTPAQPTDSAPVAENA